MATLTPFASLSDKADGIADLDAALAAAADLTNDFQNDGNLVLIVSNGDAASKTVTMKGTPDPYGRGGAGVGDEVISIPAGKIGFFPFANPAMFNSGGKATFTLSAITSVKIGVLRLTKAR